VSPSPRGGAWGAVLVQVQEFDIDELDDGLNAHA
jgi:hypothetical protein